MKQKIIPLDKELMRTAIRRGAHVHKRGSTYFMIKTPPPKNATKEGTYGDQPVYVYK